MAITLQNIQISGGGLLFSAPSVTPPPGDPYWANVSLLLNNTATNNQTNNVFLDSSTNSFTVTRLGTTTQGTFSPFPLNGSSYNASVNGASAYFDGAGDYLTIANNSALDIRSGDFTVETWFYPTSSANTKALIGQWQQTVGLSGYLLLQNGTTMQFAFGAVNENNPILSSSTPCTINAWNHIAIARSGSSFRMWLNGVSVATATSAATASAINVPTALGQYYNNSGTLGANGVTDFVGYLSSTRVVKGTAVYNTSNSTITVPTAPLTAISGTSLLLNYTNAGMYDARTKNNLVGIGDVKVSTTQAKFGTTSVAFDGTGDYLTMPTSTDFNFGTGNFTVELWTRINSFPSTFAPLFANQYLFYLGGGAEAGKVVIFNGSTNVVAGTTGDVPTNQWVHLAYVRNGNNLAIYVNSVKKAENNFSASIGSAATNTIGFYGTTALNGFIQDLRVTKGVARYTANFTPPTAPFPTY